MDLFNRLKNRLTRRHNSPQQEGLKSIISTLGILLMAPVVALVLTAFVFQSYEVDGPSMESTLQNNDRLIVLKIQRTWARITGHDYIPDRGDIVIFDQSGLLQYSGGNERQLIKRVVALPGERVVIKDGKLTVYNAKHPEGFEPDKLLPYGETIPSTSGEEDLVVPAGKVYVCGDNRANSLDSRRFGPISASDIVGKLAARVYPFGSAKTF